MEMGIWRAKTAKIIDIPGIVGIRTYWARFFEEISEKLGKGILSAN